MSPELPLLHCEADGCTGRIFQDARGGFECTDCDARYLIAQDSPRGYGGPKGPLGFFELHHGWLETIGTGLLSVSGCLIAMGNGLGAIVLGTVGICLSANAKLCRDSIAEGREKPNDAS